MPLARCSAPTSRVAGAARLGALAVPSRSALLLNPTLNARQVDDAGDGRLLLVTPGGRVALLHLLGEMARDAPDDHVGHLSFPHGVLEGAPHGLGRDLLGEPHALATVRNGFARAELLRKPPVSEGNRSSLRSISRVTICLSTCQHAGSCITKSGSLMT